MPRSDTPSHHVRVLFVSHIDADRSCLSEHLGARGFAVEAVATLEDAASLMGHHAPDVVLIDAGLPGPHVSHFIAWMRDEEGLEQIQVVLVDGECVIDGNDDARAMGARCVLAKPVSLEELVGHLTAAATTRGLLPGSLRPRRGLRPATVSARGDVDTGAWTRVTC